MSTSTPTTPSPPANNPVYDTLVRWQQSDDLRDHLAAWAYSWFICACRDKTVHRQHAYLDGIAELAGLLRDYGSVEALDTLYRQAGNDGAGAPPLIDWALRQISRWPLADPHVSDGRQRVALTRAIVWKGALWHRLHEVLAGHAPPPPPDDPPLRCSSAAILAAAQVDAGMALERIEIDRQQQQQEES